MTAGSRITSYFEQTLSLLAKLCVGGNMRTRDVVSQFVPEEVLVAVLGLNTVHDDIPDNVKSLFWCAPQLPPPPPRRATGPSPQLCRDAYDPLTVGLFPLTGDHLSLFSRGGLEEEPCNQL